MTVELLEQTVVPDSIEPIEAYRCWMFYNGKLLSLNGGGQGQEWTAGEPLTAKCNANGERQKRWVVARCGMDRDQAEEIVSRDHEIQAHSYSFSHSYPAFLPLVPKIELPDGYGWELQDCEHDCPDENCSCGIYAATTEEGVPGGGNVYGKVRLWGKVVPGENGYRAQFAYPSEFRVAPKLADRPELLAFGVPIVADDSLRVTATSLTYMADNDGLRKKMIACCIANGVLAAANLALVVIHLV